MAYRNRFGIWVENVDPNWRHAPKSEKCKQRMSQSRTGKKMKLKTRLKMSLSKIGKIPGTRKGYKVPREDTLKRVSDPKFWLKDHDLNG